MIIYTINGSDVCSFFSEELLGAIHPNNWLFIIIKYTPIRNQFELVSLSL